VRGARAHAFVPKFRVVLCVGSNRVADTSRRVADDRPSGPPLRSALEGCQADSDRPAYATKTHRAAGVRLAVTELGGFRAPMKGMGKLTEFRAETREVLRGPRLAPHAFCAGFR
jgi:hypothetical protein